MWAHLKKAHGSSMKDNYEHVDAQPVGVGKPSMSVSGAPKVSLGMIVIPVEIRIPYHFEVPTIAQGKE